MAQVKKFQDGASIAPVAKKIKFKVNGTDYEQDEQFIQDMANPFFEEMKAKGVAREKDRDAYNKTFQQYTSQAKNGVYDINSSDGKYLNSKYTGLDASLGVDENGDTARKTGIGKLISPHQNDEDQRMSMLNTFVGDRLVKQYDTDGATAKLKATEAENKLKATADKDKSDFLGKFGNYKSGSTAMYGEIDGKDTAFTQRDYWETLKREGRAGKLNAGLSGLASYAFDTKFDDLEYQKAFKDKNAGYDIGKVRETLTKYGYANGKFTKPLDVNTVSTALDDLELRSSWDSYINKPKVDAGTGTGAGGTGDGTSGTTGATGPLTQKGKFWTDGTTTFTDKDGKSPLAGLNDGLLWKNGRLMRGMNMPGMQGEGASEFFNEDPNAGYIWDGKQHSQADYEKFITNSGDENLQNQYIKERQLVQSTRTSLMDSRMESLEKFQRDGSASDAYVFNDLLKAGKNPKMAKEVTNLFDKYRGGKAKIYRYIAPGSDRFGFKGLVRYRAMDPQGVMQDGVIQPNVRGEWDLRTSSGKLIPLGVMNASQSEVDVASDFNMARPGIKKPENAIDVAVTNASASMKVGGKITKAKMGSILSKVNGATKVAESKAATGNEMYQAATDANFDLSDADKLELGALTTDVVSLGATFLPGAGNLVGAGAGLVGTGLGYAADFKRHGFNWTDVGKAGVGAALDVATAIPGLGTIAKGGKIAQRAASVAKWGVRALQAQGLTTAAASLMKLGNAGEMSIDDWRNVTGGLQALRGLKQSADHHIGTVTQKTNTIKANGQVHNIDDNASMALSKATTLQEKIEIAKSAIARSTKLDPKDIELDLKSINGEGIRGKLPEFMGGKKDKDVILGNTSERVLKNYNDETNWFVKRAIKNVAFGSPDINGVKGLGAKDQFEGLPTNTFLGQGVSMFSGSRNLKAKDTPIPDGPSSVYGQFSTIGDRSIIGDHSILGDRSVVGPSSLYKAPLQLPAASGKPMIGVDTRALPEAGKGVSMGIRKDITDPTAVRASKIKGARQRSVDNARETKLNKYSAIRNEKTKAQMEVKAAKEAEVKAKQQAEEKELNDMIKGEEREKAVAAYKQRKDLGKKLAPVYKTELKNSKLRETAKKQLAEQTAAKSTRMRPKKSRKREEGGLITKFQVGGVLTSSKFVPMFQGSGVLKKQPQYGMPAQGGLPQFQALNITAQPPAVGAQQLQPIQPFVAPPPPIPLNDMQRPAPDFSMPRPSIKADIHAGGFGTKPKPFATLTGDRTGGLVEPTFKVGIEGYKSFETSNAMNTRLLTTPITNNGSSRNDPKNSMTGVLNTIKQAGAAIDPVTASELARALAIRNNNKNINTTTIPALLQNVAESAPQVKGDLLSKSAFDNRANNMVQAAGQPTTSDGMLHTAKMLSTNQQADQTRTQGDMVNAEALNRSKMSNDQATMQFAAGRQQVANQNTGNLAAARDITRQGNNMKMASMMTPIDNFWKGENMKASYEKSQNKNVDAQINYLGMKTQLDPTSNANYTELSDIETKMDAAAATGDQATFDTLSAQKQQAVAKGTQMNNKTQMIGLQLKKNPNWQMPTNYATYDPKWTPTRKSGGTIDMVKEKGKNDREYSKQEANSSKAFSTMYENWIESATETESKEKLAALKNINDIIKLALT